MMCRWAALCPLCLCALALVAVTNEELLSAVRSGNATEVQFLLSRDSFDVNQMWFDDWLGNADTMVHEAVRGDHAEVLQLLLAAWPAGAQATDRWANTPLHLAAGRGNIECVQLLVEQWPDGVRVADDYGGLPLHCAAGSAVGVEVAQLVMQQWPDAVSVADTGGELPLHLASHTGNLELVQLLVKAWPSGLNVVNNEGRTPLYVAADWASLEVARWMLQSFPPAAYSFRLSQCERLIELACNSTESTQSWQAAAKYLECVNPQYLGLPSLQLWLENCGGSFVHVNAFGMLADQLYDPEAKDKQVPLHM